MPVWLLMCGGGGVEKKWRTCTWFLGNWLMKARSHQQPLTIKDIKGKDWFPVCSLLLAQMLLPGSPPCLRLWLMAPMFSAVLAPCACGTVSWFTYLPMSRASWWVLRGEVPAASEIISTQKKFVGEWKCLWKAEQLPHSRLVGTDHRIVKLQAKLFGYSATAVWNKGPRRQKGKL
jgi:hypothetical protein